MHLFSKDLVDLVTIRGKVDVSYLGFGPKGISYMYSTFEKVQHSINYNSNGLQYF